MKLSEYLSAGKMMTKKAKLLTDITLDNGESMKAGEVGHVLMDKGGGKYHFEHNDFACTVTSEEIEFIKDK